MVTKNQQIKEFLVTTLLVSIVGLAVFVITVHSFLGWEFNTVASSSMSPNLKVGDLVIVKPVESQTIQAGNIIVFSSSWDERLICHRVVAVTEQIPKCFQTKGDANEAPDPFTVPSQDVIGRVLWQIPWLGYIIPFLQSPPGILSLAAIPSMMLLATIVRSFRMARPNEIVVQSARGGHN